MTPERLAEIEADHGSCPISSCWALQLASALREARADRASLVEEIAALNRAWETAMEQCRGERDQARAALEPAAGMLHAALGHRAPFRSCHNDGCVAARAALGRDV